MIIRLLLVSLILVPASVNKKSMADDVLQKVLELDEVESFFSKTPRFSSSTDHKIVLLKSKEVNLSNDHKINQMPLTIANEENAYNSGLTVFLHLTEFNVSDNSAYLRLKIQNAALLYEEKKNVTLEAELLKDHDSWEIKNYKLDKVNISD